MKCIYCKRLCDFDETRACEECRIKVAVNNKKVYVLSLLKEAYSFVSDIALREKIEAVLFIGQAEQIQIGIHDGNSTR